jgi:hypothetical protein
MIQKKNSLILGIVEKDNVRKIGNIMEIELKPKVDVDMRYGMVQSITCSRFCPFLKYGDEYDDKKMCILFKEEIKADSTLDICRTITYAKISN